MVWESKTDALNYRTDKVEEKLDSIIQSQAEIKSELGVDRRFVRPSAACR